MNTTRELYTPTKTYPAGSTLVLTPGANYQRRLPIESRLCDWDANILINYFAASKTEIKFEVVFAK